MNTKEINPKDLPNFIKTKMQLINDLQKRVNQLNKDFEIEKNCKNNAYFFILENGHFDEYVKYNKSNPV